MKNALSYTKYRAIQNVLVYTKYATMPNVLIRKYAHIKNSAMQYALVYEIQSTAKRSMS